MFVIVAVGAVVGLTTALLMGGGNNNLAGGTNGATIPGGNSNNAGGDESPNPGTTSTINLNPFQMDITTSSGDDLNSEALRDVTFNHLFDGMGESFDAFKGMALEVKVDDLRLRMLQGAAAEGGDGEGRTFRAQFGGHVKFRTGADVPTSDEVEDNILVLLKDQNLIYWMESVNGKGLSVVSVRVRDAAGEETGSAKDGEADEAELTDAPVPRPRAEATTRPTYAPITPPPAEPKEEETERPVLSPTDAPTGVKDFPTPNLPKPRPIPTPNSTPRPTLRPTPNPTQRPTLRPTPIPTSRPTPPPSYPPADRNGVISEKMPEFSMVLEQVGSNSIAQILASVTYSHLDTLMKAAFDSSRGILVHVDTKTKSSPGGDGESRVVEANFTENTAKFKSNAVPSKGEIQDVLNQGFSGNNLQIWLNDVVERGVMITKVTVFNENGDTIDTALQEKEDTNIQTLTTPSESFFLATDLDVKFSRDGAMFDVVSVGEGRGGVIKITALYVHIGTSEEDIPLEVWTREGSYQGFEQDPTGWTLRNGGNPYVITESYGQGRLTPLPTDSFDPIFVAAGEAVGIYVTVVTGSGNNGGGSGTMLVGQGGETFRDDRVEIVSGASVKYPFRGSNGGRLWSGAIRYEILMA